MSIVCCILSVYSIELLLFLLFRPRFRLWLLFIVMRYIPYLHYVLSVFRIDIGLASRRPSIDPIAFRKNN